VSPGHTRFLCLAPSTGADRHRSVRLVEKTLRNIANVDDEDETALDERWLRDAACRLAASFDPARSTAKAYAQKVRDHVRQIQWPTGITPRTTWERSQGTAGLGLADV